MKYYMVHESVISSERELFHWDLEISHCTWWVFDILNVTSTMGETFNTMKYNEPCINHNTHNSKKYPLYIGVHWMY